MKLLFRPLQLDVEVVQTSDVDLTDGDLIFQEDKVTLRRHQIGIHILIRASMSRILEGSTNLQIGFKELNRLIVRVLEHDIRTEPKVDDVIRCADLCIRENNFSQSVGHQRLFLCILQRT